MEVSSEEEKKNLSGKRTLIQTQGKVRRKREAKFWDS
jgi:hypothetical protein